jgi:Xaa-Pro aminopeptidase
VHDHPAFLADMELEPGMTFELEPNFAVGRHMVHIGGTAIVGEDEPIELSPYPARVRRRPDSSSSPSPHS